MSFDRVARIAIACFYVLWRMEVDCVAVSVDAFFFT